jgi:N-acetylmuramoyl-L-alanine amidase
MLLPCFGTPLAAETPAAAKVAHLATADRLDPQTKCLALTVYWEGRAEPPEGQRAIAHTVLNRADSEGFPAGVCGVVTQGDENERFRCQFHWWCDGKADEPVEEAAWRAAIAVARAAMAGGTSDPTGGALFFHNGTVNPDWSAQRVFLAGIGRHSFYR